MKKLSRREFQRSKRKALAQLILADSGSIDAFEENHKIKFPKVIRPTMDLAEKNALFDIEEKLR